MNGQKLLNHTLKLNAVFSLISGLDFIIFDKAIAGILSEKDMGSLMPTGISLIVFAIFVFAVSMMKKVNKWLVGAIILMDSLWVFGSVFLLIGGANIFSSTGLILITVIAAIIAGFAIFQTLGLTRHLKSQTAAIALICLAFFSFANAQEAETLKVGDAKIDGSFIKDYTNEFTLENQSADGKITAAGRWTDEVKIIEKNGRKLLRRSVAVYDLSGKKTLERVHIVDHKTLAPIVLHQSFGANLDSMIHLDIDGARIRGFIFTSTDNPVLMTERTLEQPVFDLSIHATLLLGFPLKEGYSTKFPVFGQAGANNP